MKPDDIVKLTSVSRIPVFVYGWQLLDNPSISRIVNENVRYREALGRLRDCDWVISLPDRMDAVRAIAQEALGDS